MKKSYLKELIKSSLNEIKVSAPLSEEEIFNKLLNQIGWGNLYVLCQDFGDGKIFLQDTFDIESPEDYSENFDGDYDETLNLMDQVVDIVNKGKVTFLANVLYSEQQLGSIGNHQYNISQYNHLYTVEDDIFFFIVLSTFEIDV